MRLPHLLKECSLHGGSLAASSALVDGSPAQRVSNSMLVCMVDLRFAARLAGGRMRKLRERGESSGPKGFERFLNLF